ncbi:MAG: type I phosphomannose isomerase catalytic subunit [Planctomycetota bacterium]
MSIALPLRLRPIAVPKVWGGTALRRLVSDADREAIDWPESEPIGEVWLVSDRADRASVVDGGPFDGRTLHGLMLSETSALVGKAETAEGGAFPLILKLLDARSNLSIQVHPDEVAAARLGVQPKGECWYLLEADAGAEVYLGLADGVDAARFAAGAASHDVVDLLHRYAVAAGDGVDVAPGVVHAIGAGIVLVEVQHNSDATYRIYDWDRSARSSESRETQLDRALGSIDYEARSNPPGPLEFTGVDSSTSVNRAATLRRGARFHAEILEVHEPAEMAAPGLPTVLVALSGNARLAAGDESRDMKRGCTWLLPADLESARIVDADGDLRILRARPLERS